MFRQSNIQALFFLSIIGFYSCCYLPLAECGPKMFNLKTIPSEIKVAHKNITCEFKAWGYQSKKNVTDSTTLHFKITCKALSKGDTIAFPFSTSTSYFHIGEDKAFLLHQHLYEKETSTEKKKFRTTGNYDYYFRVPTRILHENINAFVALKRLPEVDGNKIVQDSLVVKIGTIKD